MFIRNVTGLNSGLAFPQIYTEFFPLFKSFLYFYQQSQRLERLNKYCLLLYMSEWICNCLFLSLVKRSCTALFSKTFVFAMGPSWSRQKWASLWNYTYKVTKKLHCTLGFSKAFDKVLLEKILNKSSCHWVYRQVFL